VIIHYGWTISNAGIKATERKVGAGAGEYVALEGVLYPAQGSLGVQSWCHLVHRLSVKKTPELMMGPVPEVPTQGKQEQRASVPPHSQCGTGPWTLVSPLALTSKQHWDCPWKHCNLNVAAALRFVHRAGVVLLCFT